MDLSWSACGKTYPVPPHSLGGFADAPPVDYSDLILNAYRKNGKTELIGQILSYRPIGIENCFKKETRMDPAVEAKANALVKADAIAALKPYPETDWRADSEGEQHIEADCPKCQQTFRAPFFAHETDSRPEQLEWCCPCGYVMRTKTLDAE